MTSRAERRHPEVEQRCDWCHAAPGSSCTNRRNEPRSECHPSRRDAWVIAHTDCTECEAPAGNPCVAGAGMPMRDIHTVRTQDAQSEYATAVEDASRDVKGGRR